MTRPKQFHAVEERSLPESVLKSKVFGQGERVGRDLEIRERQKRLYLGGERQTVSNSRVVQRLDAEAIAGQQQTMASSVPQRECEHAVKLSQKAWAHLFIQMNDNFAIRLASESVTPSKQPGAEVHVVINLTV